MSTVINGKSVDEIRVLLENSNKLFDGDDGKTFPVDGGAVLRRRVSLFENETSYQFMEWFNDHIIKSLEQKSDLEANQRVFFLSGRAGQGKSTLARHMFLHLKNQEYYNPNNLRLRPNYTHEIDANIDNFFSQYRDAVVFYQARELPSNLDPPRFNSRNFVIIDGIDEASDEKIAFISEMIHTNESSLFFITSRSRYSAIALNLKEEIINQGQLIEQLKNRGINFNSQRNSIFLKDMGHEEKKDIFGLIQEFDGDGSFPVLESLVENNSQLLRRPADFLLFRGSAIKTKSQYLVRHLRWLIQREASKDIKERVEFIEYLKFPQIFTDKNFSDVKDGKLRIEFGEDQRSKEAMQLFNLIEVEGKSKDARVYLDLTTPSSQALLLLSAGGFTAHQLYYQPGEINPEVSIDAFVEGVGRDFIEACISDAIDRSHKSPVYNFSTLIFNGYQPEGFDSFISQTKPIRGNDDLKNLIQSIHFAIWIADVFHPIDELTSGYVVEPTNELLLDCVDEFLQSEIERLEDDGNTVQNCLDERLPFIYKLFGRVAQIGPNSEKLTVFESSADIIEGIVIHEQKCNLLSFYEFQRMLMKKFIDETKDGSQEAYIKFYEETLTDLPSQNKNSKKRLFLCVYRILMLEELTDQHWGKDKSLKFHALIKQLFTQCVLPNSWPVAPFLEYSDWDLIELYSHKLGRDSKNANEIIEFFVNDSLSPELKYLNWNPELDSFQHYPSDFPLRGAKFVYNVSEKRMSPHVESLVRGIVIISRMGHLLPRNKNRFYHTTQAPDMGWYLFNSEDKTIFSEYSTNMSKLLPTLDDRELIPASFHQLLTRNSDESADRLDKNKNAINNEIQRISDHKFPQISYLKRIGMDDVQNVLRYINYLKGQGNDEEILEYYASLSSLLQSSESFDLDGYSPQLMNGLCSWLEKGEFFPAYLQSLRTPEVGFVSFLTECELYEDGYDSTKSRMVGNYLHRRQTTLDSYKHYPNYLSNPKSGTLSRLTNDEGDVAETSFSEFIRLYSASLRPLARPLHYLQKVSKKWFNHTFEPEIKNLQCEGNTVKFYVGIEEGEIISHKNINRESISNSILPNLSLDLESLTLSKIVDYPSAADLRKYIKESENHPLLPTIGKPVETNAFVHLYENLFPFQQKGLVLRPNIPDEVLTKKWREDKTILIFELNEVIHHDHENNHQLKYDVFMHRSNETTRINLDKNGYYHPLSIKHEDYLQYIVPQIIFSKMRDYYLKYKLSRRKKEELKAFIKKLKQDIRNGSLESILKEVFPTPYKIGKQLENGNALVLDGWHTLPYFSQQSVKENLNLTIENILDCISDEESERFILHLTEDESIIEGSNLKLELKKGNWKEGIRDRYSIMGGKISADVHFSKINQTHHSTKGIFSIVHDSSQDRSSYNVGDWIEYTHNESRCIGNIVEKIHEDEIRIAPTEGEQTVINVEDISKLDNWPGSWVEVQTNEETILGRITDIDLEKDLVLINTPEGQEVEGSYEEAKRVRTACRDLRLLPEGLRTIMRHNSMFDDSNEKSLDKIYFASTKLSSLAYSHRKSANHETITNPEKTLRGDVLTDTEEIPPEWIHRTLFKTQNNRLYGQKFGFQGPDEENGYQVQGFAEYDILRFSSNKPRKVCNLFVEVDDDEYRTDYRYIHSNWKSKVLMAAEIPDIMDAAERNPKLQSGKRLCRTFGVVIDHGRFDEEKEQQIRKSIDKIRENFNQLQSRERVVGGRTNLIHTMRLFTTHFAYSDWMDGYLETYNALRGEIEKILDDIQAEEERQLGVQLPGTIYDFRIARSMLKGIEFKAKEFAKNIDEKRKHLLEKINQQNALNKISFNEFKNEMKLLSFYLDEEKLSELCDAALSNHVGTDSLEKEKIQEMNRPRRRLKIRVLGMPQSCYPFAITTDWSEVLGTMARSPDECQIGSVIRLDLKHKVKVGTMEPIVANVAYAIDELDENGDLISKFNESIIKPNVNHSLKETTWLPIGKTDDEIKEYNTISDILLYVKKRNGYGIHPEIENEIPLFNREMEIGQSDGALCRCTIDIRRDRIRGSFRYYVTEMNALE